MMFVGKIVSFMIYGLITLNNELCTKSYRLTYLKFVVIVFRRCNFAVPALSAYRYLNFTIFFYYLQISNDTH